MSRTLETILTHWEEGTLSSPLAAMEMLLVTRSLPKVEAWLSLQKAITGRPRGDELLRLLRENREGCVRVVRIASDDAPLRDVEDVGALFDRTVATCEDASVALYSLGNTTILDKATREIAETLLGWGLLGADRDLLDLGCGIGRFEVALSPHVHGMVGIDVSAKMVEVARRRVAGLANVRIDLGSGLELPFADHAFDVVLANFREMARVLRAAGDVVILEFSYRDDLEQDRADLAALAQRHGFDVLENGSSPFALWNGRAFRLRHVVTAPPSEGTRRMDRGRRREG
jgi:SAM-dependent methyltransferase